MIVCVLKKYREDAGLSQVELASRASVTQAQVSRWENGTEMPKVETLVNLGKALQIEWSLLIEANQLA